MRRAAGKGATHYGIGSTVARIVDVLLPDRRANLTVCSRITDVAGFDGVTLASRTLFTREFEQN